MRDISLLEQKKLQWAKEKEELSKLNDFFAATTSNHQFERTSIRTYYSNVDISSSSVSSVKSNTIPRRAAYYQEPYKENAGGGVGGKDVRRDSCRDYPIEPSYENGGLGPLRAPMLPPISRSSRQKLASSSINKPAHPSQFVHQNTDEETSGYLSAGLSDRLSPQMWTKQMPPHPSQFHHLQQHPKPNLPKDFSNYIYPSSGDELAPELDEMKIEERRRIPKHRPPPQAASSSEIDDNGHETDFTMPKTPSSLCSDNRNYSRLLSCPPCRKDKEERAKWGDRSSHLYDSISKESSVKSDGPCWLERGFADSGDESVRSYSFIRGQNAPIDPNILAERTTKRIKAIELQNAIKAQVEERERLRKLEHEKSLLEERRLEENLRQQRESNEQRFEEEQRITREKLERDQRKQEMMRMAIEKARQEAELERARRKRSLYAASSGCASPTLHNEDLNKLDAPTTASATIDEIRNRNNRTEVSNTPRPIETDDTHDSADDEKILIGTPIRMRKKTLNKSSKGLPSSAKKSAELLAPTEKESNSSSAVNGSTANVPATTVNATVAAPETNVDGIALVLQTLPPIMPILNTENIINLNQNINNLNTSNIQLAVMLAHQMQQLNSFAQNQNQNPRTHPELLSNRAQHAATESHNEKNAAAVEPDTVTPSSRKDGNDICRQCTSGTTDRGKEASTPETKTVPPDGECSATTKDAATVTDDFVSEQIETQKLSNGLLDSDANTNRIVDRAQVIDASTQTDRKQEYCFQCRYHHCHHHHVIVKDAIAIDDDLSVKTVAVNHHVTNSTAASKLLKCSEKECASAPIGHHRTSTYGSDAKEPSSTKLEDRPKWGVNRPLHKFLKASERDPMYLRNKRKKHHQKRQYAVDDINSRCCDGDTSKEDSAQGSRSTSPSPSIITNSTVTLSSPSLKTNRKRSVCTEILPIKTDMNGRVYLNFTDAKLHVTEDEQRPSSKQQQQQQQQQRPQKFRMINRSRTANDIRTLIDEKNHDKEIET